MIVNYAILLFTVSEESTETRLPYWLSETLNCFYYQMTS